MAEQGNAAWGDRVARRARVRGVLLGGAIGDALGNPVEFLSLGGIRRAHGEGAYGDPSRTRTVSSAGSRTTPR